MYQYTSSPYLTMAGGSDTGHRYPANFDVLHLNDTPQAVIVADGMGAGEGSATAGRLAVATLVEHLARTAKTAETPVTPSLLREAIAQAQDNVVAAGQQLGELTGCTLSALLPGTAANPSEGWIVHIGDSRVYRLRHGMLELLTTDHTMAWLGAIYGWYAPGSHQAMQARYHLIRFIGHQDRPEPDVLNVTLRPGDVYCICTDGLAEQVSYQRLSAALGRRESPKVIVEGLLADALAAGGNDNATLAIVTVGDLHQG